ncbi:MAG: D-aminoacyl-tRNA deacylase [Desulforegulaceae bacterium]|nr:D-aminoacyl-tRNA deacylase [Desulforegulaceae bacterium]
MKAIIQRTNYSKVEVEDKIIGEIKKGLLVFLGVTHEDSEKEADYLADKIINLRIFSDNEDKMNLSLLDIKGEILVVSQFTLYADTKKGRRPSFVKAAKPEKAERLYNYFIEKLKGKGIKPQTGKFQETMNVSLLNNGPVTIIVDTDD